MKRFFPWLGLALFLGCFLALIFEGIRLPSGYRFWEPTVFDTVVIDAGHGGGDPGAIGNGLIEKRLTLDVAQRLKERLELLGLKVAMTRTDDTYLALSTRARLGNRQRGAIFVSIHFNTSSAKSARGLEIYHYVPPVTGPVLVSADAGGDSEHPSDSEILADEIQASVIARSSAADRGVKAGDFHVIRNSRLPAVLIEGGFLSNRAEAQLVGTSTYRQTLAEGIAEGIVNYRNKLESATEFSPLSVPNE